MEGCTSSTTLPVSAVMTGASSVPVILMVILIVEPSLSVITYTSETCSPSANSRVPSVVLKVQLPFSSTTTSPYSPVIVSATTTSSGLSGSETVTVPLAVESSSSVTSAVPPLVPVPPVVPPELPPDPLVPPLSPLVPSVSVPVSVETVTTGESSVPVRLIVTVVVEPSLKVTVKTSVCCSPSASPWVSGPETKVQAPVSSTVNSP